mgnify:CR=1 FL=1
MILCGSALSFMEKKVLSEKSLCLEDVIRRFKLEAFNYLDAANLFQTIQMRIRQFVMEFSDISLVNNIVEQIAFGENTLNTIAGKIGEKEPTVL